MKIIVSALNRKASARVPDKVVEDGELQLLAPLSFHLLVYVANLWDQRQREIAHIPRSRRSLMHYEFQVSLRTLHAHLKPEAQSRFENHDYRYLRAAVKQLSRVQASEDSIDVQGKRSHESLNLITRVRYSEAGSMLSFTLSPYFEEALRMMDRQGRFALILLADALALNDTRHLMMLVLASKVEKLYVPDRRTFTVDHLRSLFGLQGRSYEQWREAFRKLKEAADAVVSTTSFSKVTLHPIRDKCDARRVVGVRIDSKRLEPKQLAAHPRVSSKPTLSPRVAQHLAQVRLARAKEQQSTTTTPNYKPRILRRRDEGGSCSTDIFDQGR